MRKSHSTFIRSLIFILIFTQLEQTHALIGIQRTLNSSADSFQAYLKETSSSPFVQAYIDVSQKMEVSSRYIEICLENIYLGRSGEEDCLLALKDLTQRPLNSERREILYSFLTKIEVQKSNKRDFFRQFKLGLLETDSELRDLKRSDRKKVSATIPPRFALLEAVAWKKALKKKVNLSEAQILINGMRVKQLEKWTPPEGIYQWALITNTHEPLIRLGTFLQFASDSLKDLKPFAENCKALSDYEIKKFDLLQVQVFASDKCIAKESSIKMTEPQHLAQVPNTPALQQGRTHWIWPTLLLVGAGLYIGTRGKNVQVSMPSFK